MSLKRKVRWLVPIQFSPILYMFGNNGWKVGFTNPKKIQIYVFENEGWMVGSTSILTYFIYVWKSRLESWFY